ncbi:MAG: hypothetical protein JW741_22750, partial [Sedimentisphaerales bacterium]|nr:hypothetical protein [Sedimentisphaerales bacterium]
MAKTRLLFVDNLRTMLIVLVVMVHLSITYGGEGGWYYEGQADLRSLHGRASALNPTFPIRLKNVRKSLFYRPQVAKVGTTSL